MDTDRRIHRVEREIQHIVSSFLVSEGQGLLPGIVSVAEVSVSKDLRHAKIFLSYLGDETSREECIDVVEDLRPEAQRRLAHSLATKFCPRLRFYVSRGSSLGLE
jgi:ribosome-binding factor A